MTTLELLPRAPDLAPPRVGRPQQSGPLTVLPLFGADAGARLVPPLAGADRVPEPLRAARRPDGAAVLPQRPLGRRGGGAAPGVVPRGVDAAGLLLLRHRRLGGGGARRAARGA